MGRIKGKNTGPEVIVRSLIHGLGYRFRLNLESLPGKPDIILPRYQKVIFIHGCFWHGHADCKRARLPSSNVEFWQAKIAANIERDLRSIQALKGLGWHTLVVWSCETGNKTLLTQKLKGFMTDDTSSTKK